MPRINNYSSMMKTLVMACALAAASKIAFADEKPKAGATKDNAAKSTTANAPAKPRASAPAKPAATEAAAAPSSNANAPATDPLALERWSERSYGLSLRPPLGARLVEMTADDAILRIFGPGGDYIITLSIRKSPVAVSIDKVMETSIAQLAIAQPAARLMSRKALKPAGRDGGALYLLMPETRKDPKPWVLGQGFMQIDPLIVAVLNLEVDAEKYQRIEPIFEALVMSMGVENPADLDRERQEQIDAAENWRKTINAKRRQMALVPEQWFRVVSGKNDVGYTRVRQSVARMMEQPGIQVEIQARVQVDDKVFESNSSFFLSEDGEKEVWSVRTSAKPISASESGDSPAPNRKPAVTPTRKLAAPDSFSWSETGLRAGNEITVNREMPTGTRTYKWQQPPRSYLSQAELFLLDSLLPRQQAATYGFYAYYSNTGRMAYRTERLVPESNGGFRIFSRPSPENPEQVTIFDAQGRMIRRELPGGRVMMPTTLEQVKNQWKIKG